MSLRRHTSRTETTSLLGIPVSRWTRYLPSCTLPDALRASLLEGLRLLTYYLRVTTYFLLFPPLLTSRQAIAGSFLPLIFLLDRVLFIPKCSNSKSAAVTHLSLRILIPSFVLITTFSSSLFFLSLFFLSFFPLCFPPFHSLFTPGNHRTG